MSIEYITPEKMMALPDRFLAIYKNISYKGSNLKFPESETHVTHLSFLRKQESTFSADSCFRRNDSGA